MKRYSALFGIVILLFFTFACSLQNVTPKTTNEKIYAANASVVALGKTALTLYNEKKITQKQLSYVYETLLTASNLLDNARKLEVANATKSDEVVTSAVIILNNLNDYLNKYKGGNK